MGTLRNNSFARHVEPKKKFLSLNLMIIILLTAFAVVAGQLTFPTGPPELTKVGGTVVPKTEEEYALFSEQMKNNPGFVTIKKKPADLGPGALYGWNFVVEGTNTCPCRP